jgi:hypothetical protein
LIFFIIFCRLVFLGLNGLRFSFRHLKEYRLSWLFGWLRCHGLRLFRLSFRSKCSP